MEEGCQLDRALPAFSPGDMIARNKPFLGILCRLRVLLPLTARGELDEY